jgi:hypothetical protein
MPSMYYGSPVSNSLLYECTLLRDTDSKCSAEVLGAVEVGE